jgi:hypothetical protein
MSKENTMKNPVNYVVNLPNKESVRSSLYDFQTYNAAGHSELTFFQVPKGANGKTLEDTNIDQAGSLPAGKTFVIETVELYFFSGSPVSSSLAADNNAHQADDLYQFISHGYLDLFIGSKSYLTEAPLGRFPASTGLRVEGGIATGAATVGKNEYATSTGLIYRVEPNITLVSTQNFNVSLNWRTPIAMPSGLNARVGVVMRGLLQRNSQ